MRDRMVSVVFKHTLSDAGFSTFEQAKQAAKESLKTFIQGAADQEERRLSRNVEVLRIETTIAAYIELTEIDVFGRDAKFSVTELTTRTES